MRVYLGGAIDHATDDPVQRFSDLARVITSVVPGAVLFNPMSAFLNTGSTRDAHTNEYVVHVNRSALDAADLAVFLWSDHPSFGVPLEIFWRAQAGQPFVIWYRSSRLPGIYMGHVVETSAGRIVRTEGELLSYLATFRDALVAQDGQSEGGDKCQPMAEVTS